MAIGIERRSRAALFGLIVFAAACPALLGCGDGSSDGAISTNDETVTIAAEGEPVFPVERVGEVAGMADAIVILEVLAIEAPELPGEGEGAVPRLAQVEVVELIWPDAVDSADSLRPGERFTVGAGLVGYRDGEFLHRIVLDSQPWFEQGRSYASAVVSRSDSYGLLPWTTMLLESGRLVQIEGQAQTDYSRAVAGGDLDALRRIVSAEVSVSEHAELQRLEPYERLDAVIAERIAEARAGDEGE